MSNPGVFPDGSLDPAYNRRIEAHNSHLQPQHTIPRSLGPRPHQLPYSSHPSQQPGYPYHPQPNSQPPNMYNRPYHPQGHATYNAQPHQQQQYPPQPYAHQGYPQPPPMRPPHDINRATYNPNPNYSPVAPGAAYMSSFRPSGRKKALLVGINYRGTNSALRGCVRDVTFVHHLLVSKFGFRTEDFVVLTDEENDIKGGVHKGPPTRQVIIDSLKWLVEGSRPGDSLWFSFSGHGSQVLDKNGDEVDGYDETILPVDFKTAGHIVDDELYDIVRRVSRGARLTVLLDACHSGTGLDLPYQHDVFGTGTGERISDKRPSLAAGLMGIAGAFVNGGGGSAFQAGVNFANNYRRRKRPVQGPDPNVGEVLLFAGCRDGETSADTSKLAGGLTTGAMTFALIEALEHSSVNDWRNYNYRELLKTMRRKMIGTKLKQVPQFSTSHPFDLNSQFML